MSDKLQNTQMLLSSNLLKYGLALSLPVLISACDVGTETVGNPFNGGTAANSAYTGPAPRGAEELKFMNTVWVGLKSGSKCGQCHDSDGDASNFDFVNELDVNVAYDLVDSLNLVDLDDPASSRLVTKVRNDLHGCWNPGFENVCAETIENMVTNWAGDFDNTTARAIPLTAPAIKSPDSALNFPATGDTDPDLTDGSNTSFENTVYPLLTTYCSACHYEQGTNQQQNPFFADPTDVNSSYDAAKTKMNIDFPVNSRFVDRLLDGHQCWSGLAMCADDAAEMQTAIQTFADSIPVTPFNTNLVASKALILLEDGIIASGGNRHEADTIALYEFKAGIGNKAYDTSGVGEAMDLNLTGNYSWLGAYGLDFTGGKAQASTSSSEKLFDLIQISQQYTVEAWVIPDNVTQEDAAIISYDFGPMEKNFALSQTMYNYNFSNRTNQSDDKGDAFISTEDAGEIAQSSLQHVVVTYGPDALSSDSVRRVIYVNGERINVDDPITSATLINNWDTDFAFVLGQNTSGGQPWAGKVRMVAVHNRVFTPEQVLQNFEVGVGQKYFLLFSVSEQLVANIPSCLPDVDTHNCFIKFEVSQFDDYSYLFQEPTFVNLDPSWVPTSSFTIKNMRIGINGKEAVAGQTYATMSETVNSTNYIAAEGQLLSRKGAVISLEKGASEDIFFLTFEMLDTGNTFNFVDISPSVPPVPDEVDPVSDIGVRTFEEINATIAAMTGVSTTESTIPAFFDTTNNVDVFVNDVFTQYKQQLPAVENIDAFLSSHQMAIAQLALSYCSVRVEMDAALPTGDPAREMFTDFDFELPANTAFDDTLNPSNKSNAITPILDTVLLSGLSTAPNDIQPDATEVSDLLGSDTQPTLSWTGGSDTYDSLITEMTKCPAPGDPHYKDDPSNPGSPLFSCSVVDDINTTDRTKEIVKAICAASVGSAAMLIQ